MVQTTPPPLTVSLPGSSPSDAERPVCIDVEGLNFYYGQKRALENISVGILAKLVTATV